MKMPGMEGLELFKTARKIDPEISGIIMTAYGSISSAVAAIKHGASDYLQKPFEPDSLLMVIEKTARERQMLQEIRHLRKEVNKKYAFGSIIGKNYKMQAIYALIKKVSGTDARVFITGETGVGKELVAKAIHFNSPRKNRPFVSINCGALAETLLETELFGHEKGAFTGAERAKPGKFDTLLGLEFIDKVVNIDQSPIGRTPRSNPATYTKVFDHIRKLFAQLPESRARGYQPGRFSFNVKGGRCEACGGGGSVLVEMHFLADMYVPCQVCRGRRYNENTLQVFYRGKSIRDILDMSVGEVRELFQHQQMVNRPQGIVTRVLIQGESVWHDGRFMDVLGSRSLGRALRVV